MGQIASGVWISLALYFILMLGIGVYAYFRQQRSIEGYMLGDRGLGPAVTALSAGASDMSGWLLLGLPGYMYGSGIVSLWIAVGLTIGAFANYLLVAPRLRVYTEVTNAITLPDFFANRFHDTTHLLRMISAVVVIVFFTVYTAASLVSGGKLFENSLGLEYSLGLWVTAGVVVAYTLFGGFLAVSLTDFVQGVIMLIAMLVVPYVAFNEVGGIANGIAVAKSLDPKLFDLMNGVTVMGAVSLMAWGLGYFGQPHIIVRFMAIRSVKDIPVACGIGMSWMIVSLAGALLVGLSGIAYIHQHSMALEDPETIFLVFAGLLFHPLVSGFLLAAILAAIMSTISSQLLVVSSSLTRDVYQLFLDKTASEERQVLVGRISVVVVAVVAILLAGDKENSVLDMVSHAWAGFGASFGPLVLLGLMWKRMNWQGALAGMVVGALTVIVWVYGGFTIGGEPANKVIYSIMPGFVFSVIATVVVSLMTPAPSQKIYDEFEDMKKQLK